MSSIKLANILAEKRRGKGITQEELAAYIGVSTAAVSKWEKGLSYPDITFLPQLAAYFNISVDDLLGYSPQLNKEDIWKLCRRLSADFSNRPYDEVKAECREIIKKYYSCFPLLYHLALLMFNHYVLFTEKGKQKEMIEEAKSLCSRIIVESGDALLSKDATILKAFCALELEDPAEIFQLLGESVRPQGYITEAELISQAFELAGNSEEALKVSQCGMYSHLISLINSLVYFIVLPGRGFELAETALKRAMELERTFNIDKLDWNTMVKLYIAGAVMYCRNDRTEEALALLEKYTDLCMSVTIPVEFKGDSFFTEINGWLADEIYAVLPYDEKLIKRSMLGTLTAMPEISKPLKDEPRYKRLVERLTEYGGSQ